MYPDYRCVYNNNNNNNKIITTRLTFSARIEDLSAKLVDVVYPGGLGVLLRGVVAPRVGRVLSLNELSAGDENIQSHTRLMP